MVRIAIEATGCDKGFAEIARGANAALKENSDLELILVAGRDKLPENYFEMFDKNQVVLTDHTYHASGEKLEKRKTSIFGAIKLHKNGEVDAVIAPGDTVGSVEGSLLLKRIKGVIKPALAAHLPYKNVLIDVGAIPVAEPIHLLQSAIMGNVYSESVLGVESPLIGLINIGEEDHKGPENIRNARELLNNLNGYNLSDKYFEGNTLPDNVDGNLVVVCDGFLGNNLLKMGEGTLKLRKRLIEEEIAKMPKFAQKLAKFGRGIAYLTMKKQYDGLEIDFDPSRYATSPLLGVNGNIMVSHGAADAKSITNAIRITARYVRCNVNERVAEEISKYGKI